MKDKNWHLAYQKARYAKRMKLAIEELGGQCVECASTNELQLDHIDPKTKEFNVSRLTNRSLATFLKELEKCQLLCFDCHVEKTRKDRAEKNGRPVSVKSP
jgi:5-methylcytosine-specific restriction endonuclease McrA